MSADTATTPHLDLVIFGASGDLSVRKLLPALFMAHQHGSLPTQTRIIGVGRQAWTHAQYQQFVNEKSPDFIDKASRDSGEWSRFVSLLRFVSLDAQDASSYQALAAECNPSHPRVFYLATSPHLFADTVEHLHQAGLLNDQTRLVLEKPLGTDLASAKAIHTAVGRYLREDQIYRIDHYLGKETVQNLMVLRFGNAIFEPLWRAPFIKSVQITVAETVGVGSRAGFYDSAGALRDMVQNHLLQLLCIVAMEPPVSLHADDVRDEKLKVLRSLRPLDLTAIKRDTVRGQYTEGVAEGQSAKGYRQEEGVPAESHTETFVALKAHIDNARWANVPFFLRTGKRMQKRESQIIIEFADQPFSIFGRSPNQEANRLIIRLQPEESIHLSLMVKEPGSGLMLRPVQLGLDLLSSSSKRRAEAYERLLLDVIKGRLTHFMRRDELEAAWRWIEPILEGWQSLDDKPRSYPAGSWGPAASSALMARDNLSWFEEA